MPDYETMYQIMSHAAAQAMQLLADAHWRCEELYLSERGEGGGAVSPSQDDPQGAASDAGTRLDC